jgi:hypothetical protein
MDHSQELKEESLETKGSGKYQNQRTSNSGSKEFTEQKEYSADKTK